ncbi:MAG: hypothetical protein JW774_00100 [Candidatus Aureabacteria bacterium]|nr:hypothetical protein [Candidatus Auribacterota bacterium]
MEESTAIKQVIDHVSRIGWAALYAFIGSFLGVCFVFLSASYLPKIINKLTPNLDEEKEIARGNVAVAEYFGRVVSAVTIGVSIIVAVSIFCGLFLVS